MNLRVLTPEDAAVYRDLRLRALREWPPAFGTPAEEEAMVSLDAFADRLIATKQQRLFGAFEDDALAGSVRLSRYDGSNESHRAYIAGLYIAPEYRKKGYGRALILHAIEHARSEGDLRRLNLTVVSEQKAAIILYYSVGFTDYGVEREAFECRGHFFDEILMTLDLRKPEKALQPTAACVTLPAGLFAPGRKRATGCRR